MLKQAHTEIAIGAMWCAGFTRAEAIREAQRSMPSLPDYFVTTIFDSQNVKLIKKLKEAKS